MRCKKSGCRRYAMREDTGGYCYSHSRDPKIVKKRSQAGKRIDDEHKMKEVKFLSWDRFETMGLIVAPSLLGLCHEFNNNGSIIGITLPSADALDSDEKYHERLRVRQYHIVDGEEVPSQVAVKTVDVTVCKNQKIRVPVQVLSVQPNAYDLLSKNQQNQLEGFERSYSPIARNAFDLWLRTLRWKSGKGSIGRPETRGPETGWGTYLLDADTKKRFWAGTSIVNVTIYREIVTLAIWKEVERSLQNGETAPIYYDFLFDAGEHFKHGDYNRAVIDAAVACETYLRTCVNQELPEELGVAFREYIDDANIRQVLKYFLDGILSEVQKKRLSKIRTGLHKLFDARNDLMHSGHFRDRKSKQIRDLTEDDCRGFLETARKLIGLSEPAQDTQMKGEESQNGGQRDE